MPPESQSGELSTAAIEKRMLITQKDLIKIALLSYCKDIHQTQELSARDYGYVYIAINGITYLLNHEYVHVRSSKRQISRSDIMNFYDNQFSALFSQNLSQL